MNWESVLKLVWAALNSPAGIAFLAGALLWALNRVYAAKPAWVSFEGAIITAIKTAEKAVPDETTNKGLARLDAALKFVVKVYEEAKGRKPSAKTVAALKEGIQITHDKLQAAGTLR